MVEDPEKKVVVVGGTTVDGSETKEVEIYRVVHVNGGDSLFLAGEGMHKEKHEEF